jgi:hypothetical protein
LRSLAGPQASYVFQLGLLLRRLATQQIDQQKCEPWLPPAILELAQYFNVD